MDSWKEFLDKQRDYILHDVAWFKEVCSRSNADDLFDDLKNDLNAELLR